MGGGEVVVAVLNLMEVLDQQVATPRGVTEERADLFECFRIDRPAFWLRSDLAALAPSSGGAAFPGGRRCDGATHRRGRNAEISRYSLAFS
jgi:hypothetical protein